MTPGTVMKAALGDLVGGRFFMSTFPQERLPEWPAIRGTVINEDNFASLCGDDPLVDDVMVQLDVVAQTYDAMRALKANVLDRIALITDPPVERQAGSFETFDSETKTHRWVVTVVLKPSSNEDSP